MDINQQFDIHAYALRKAQQAIMNISPDPTLPLHDRNAYQRGLGDAGAAVGAMIANLACAKENLRTTKEKFKACPICGAPIRAITHHDLGEVSIDEQGDVVAAPHAALEMRTEVYCETGHDVTEMLLAAGHESPEPRP